MTTPPTRPDKTPRRIVWPALLLSGALGTVSGCANSPFRWIEGPPAAPGSGMHPDPAYVASPSTPTKAREPAAAPAPEPFDPEQRQRITLVDPWVNQAARANGLDPALVHGVIWVESRHQPRAKSSAGARGLMQLMPATANAMARKLGENRAHVYDPEFNIMAGSLYLAQQAKRYDGDMRLALAAYNAGAGNVDRWLAEDGALPPNSVRYVELVMDAKRRFELRHAPPPVTRPVDTMFARAAEPDALVPEPPRRVQDGDTFHDEALGQVPRYVVVAPEPGANDTPPPIEPPLGETPYPPNDEEVFGVPSPAPTAAAHTDAPATRSDDASELPGVFD